MLDVRQKRRIYDITNVLEGIGLIEKETKNTIRWKCVRACVCVSIHLPHFRPQRKGNGSGQHLF